MEKKLSTDAKKAILEDVRNETDRVLNHKFEELEKNMTEQISKNIKNYLLANSDQIIEKSKKNYRKKVRNSIQAILDGYAELRDFVNSANQASYKVRTNYKANEIVRSNQSFFSRYK